MTEMPGRIPADPEVECFVFLLVTGLGGVALVVGGLLGWLQNRHEDK